MNAASTRALDICVYMYIVVYIYDVPCAGRTPAFLNLAVEGQRGLGRALGIVSTILVGGAHYKSSTRGPRAPPKLYIMGYISALATCSFASFTMLSAVRFLRCAQRGALIHVK